MLAGRVKIAVLLLSITLPSTVQPLLAKKKQNETPPSGAGDRKRALHALNRLTFGPRPGDVQRVMAMGVDKWIDLQLHPETIDDSALDARLEPFRTTRMSTKEIAEDFPDGQEIHQVMNGKKPRPADAALRMVYQVQIDRQQEKKARQESTKIARSTPYTNASADHFVTNAVTNTAMNPATNSSMENEILTEANHKNAHNS